jgi:hypothetical protein
MLVGNAGSRVELQPVACFLDPKWAAASGNLLLHFQMRSSLPLVLHLSTLATSQQAEIAGLSKVLHCRVRECWVDRQEPVSVGGQ